MKRKYTEQQLYMFEKPEITCSDVEKLYGEYVEGDLPQSLRGRLDSHVEECGECQEFVQSYQMTIKLARELANRPVPNEVKRRLREALSARLGINI